MKYNVHDKLSLKENFLLSLQLMLSCFTATILIASICQVNIAGALAGAGLSTIVYLLITNFSSPMFISNSGAFVTPVVAALATGGYFAVFAGGLTAAIVYSVFGLIFQRVSSDKIYRFLPKVLIGSITVVIGINLMTFIPTYLGDNSSINIFVALLTTLIIAIASHLLKGTLSMFPFLIGTLAGYIASIPFGLVDFSIFDGTLFCFPTFAFTQIKMTSATAIAAVIITYIAYTISAICECLSDHAALGNIIGVDLYKQPGLGRIFLGMGGANLTTALFGGLGACSYGEGVACVGFSKCASVRVTFGAALIMILLSFIAPIQQFIMSIPSCVFAGCAIILYGFIANSGIKILQDVDLNNQKNLIVCSSVLSIGISGIVLGNQTFSLSGTALALLSGIILNLVLKDGINETSKT